MKYINFILALLCFMQFSVAQELDLLTKQEAISQALSNNFGIEIANNNVAISDNNQGILNSGFLPSLTGNAGADYSLQDQKATFQNGETSEVDGAETKRYNASLNLNYTLFDGLGRWYDYKALKETYNLSQLQAQETIETTMLQLFTVYYEVARLTENVGVLRQTLSNTKRRLQRAEYAFEYGQNNKLDVLNAEVDIVTDSINLMNVKQQLKNAKRDLNVITNDNLQREFSVDTVVVFTNSLLMENYFQTADTNNVSIKQANQNIKISD